jgi:hypothetical protein
MEYRLRNKRFQYELTLFQSSLRDAGLPQEAPKVLDTQVPGRFKNSKISILADQLFKDLKDPNEKSRAIQSYFSANQFEPYQGEDLTADEVKIYSETEGGPSTLEYFLFVKKKGHCELYASSMALMLRMGGVPARLVSGFRIGRWPISDIVTVRMSDAHAWVEYYRQGVGWIPVDPTPKKLRESYYSDWISDHYDWMSGKWYQYVMTFGEDSNFITDRVKDIKSSWEQLKRGPEGWKSNDFQDLAIFSGFFILVSGTLSAIALRFVRIKRRTTQTYSRVTAEIQREQNRFEKLISKYPQSHLNPVARPYIDRWNQAYQKVRFDRPSLNPEFELKKIGQIRKELGRILKNKQS